VSIRSLTRATQPAERGGAAGYSTSGRGGTPAAQPTGGVAPRAAQPTGAVESAGAADGARGASGGGKRAAIQSAASEGAKRGCMTPEWWVGHQRAVSSTPARR